MNESIVKNIAIAKFSEEQYLKEIITNEELFFNTINFFSKKEHQNYRFDQYEGCDRIYQPSYIVNFKIDGRSFKFAKDGKPVKIRLSTTDYFTHICCFTIIKNVIIIRKKERKVFDPRLFNFGDHLILSLEIGKILSLIGKACKEDSNIEKYQISPVEYIDVKNHNGEWDVFHKPLKYKYQNEFRIAVKINTIESYKLKVPGFSKLFLGIQNKEKCINKVFNEEAIIS